jgi:hypothetical protein
MKNFKAEMAPANEKKNALKELCKINLQPSKIEKVIPGGFGCVLPSKERCVSVGFLLNYLTDHVTMIDFSFGPEDGCDTVSFFSETDTSEEIKKHVIISEEFKHCYVLDKGFRSGFYTTVVFYKSRG